MTSLNLFSTSLVIILVSISSSVEGDEVSIPARLQKSYPLYGLVCFPVGMLLPCDCEDDAYTPCCRDHVTNECYMPTYKKWSDWIPCTFCDDMCDDTMECRIKYDEVTEIARPSELEPMRRRKRDAPEVDDGEGRPTMEDMKSWNHRCRVQHSECRARFSGEWSGWEMNGPCSSSCHRGIQSEVRFCLDEDGNVIDDAMCVGGDDEGYRQFECNTELCPSVTDWEADGECYIDGIQCLLNRTRTCTSEDVEFTLTEECDSEIISCPNNTCNFEGISTHTFGSWSPCNGTCMPGWTTSVGKCVYVSDGSPSTECDPLEITKVEECYTDYCHQYTSWAPATVCTEECGGGTLEERRDCVVSGSVIPEGCNTRTVDCNEEPCPTYGYDWAEWGPCDETCTNGTRTRSGSCIDTVTNAPSDLCVDGETTTQTGPCNEDLCIEYGEWIAVGACSQTCGDGEQTYQRICDVVGTDSTPTLPSACISEVQSCNEGICFTVGDWSEYGNCTDSCSPGNKTRTRDCLNEDTNEVVEGCSEHLSETINCNEDLCTEYGSAPGGECLPSINSCQIPATEIEGTCVGTGTVPAACAITRYETCSYTGPEKAYDLVVVMDSTVSIDTSCVVRVGRPVNDPDLKDETKFPNFIKQNEFLKELYCAWPFIGSDETRIGLFKHTRACAGVSELLVHMSEENAFLNKLDNIGLDCEDSNIAGVYGCLVDVFDSSTGARKDGTKEVILFLLPPLTSTLRDTMSQIVEYKQYFPITQNVIIFIMTLDTAPTAEDITFLKGLACFQMAIGECAKYLGSVHDKTAQEVITAMMAVVDA